MAAGIKRGRFGGKGGGFKGDEKKASAWFYFLIYLFTHIFFLFPRASRAA